jgi:hypothetical protein
MAGTARMTGAVAAVAGVGGAATARGVTLTPNPSSWMHTRGEGFVFVAGGVA